MAGGQALKVDVAVIGAGVAGAYCAWRLAERPFKVGLFEHGKRVGGRLFTAHLPGAPHVNCELGGMRFVKDQHLLVQSLVGELKLATAPFLMGDPTPGSDGKPIGAANNFMYLRDTHLLVRELNDPAKVPYNLAWSERGLSPDELQRRLIKMLVPDADNLRPEAWFDVKVFGQELYKYGYWNLLYRVLSSEAYQFMKDACGYEANVANANAVLQLPATEYSNETVFLKLRDGYQALPVRMVERFEKAGGSVHRNHRLARIDRSGASGRYELTFCRTHTDSDDRTKESNTRRVVHADQVILAMPRRSIELIDWVPLREPEIARVVKSVLIQKAFKLFLAYPKPWWRALGLVAGRSITNMPVRQIYYFGVEGEEACNDPNANPEFQNNAVLMASYSDLGDVPFWKGLEPVHPDDLFHRRYEDSRPRPKRYAEEDEYTAERLPYQASKQMVRMAQRQVAQVHGQFELPQPYAAIYHEWGEDPYGGGWHEWKAGFKYFDEMRKMRRPVDGEHVFVVGEAYSNNQGWVEGALQTAEHVLQDYFGLLRPCWLPSSADLGP